MKRVYKYEGTMGDWVQFELPEGAEILHINIQKDSVDAPVCLWALIDIDIKTVTPRVVRIAGTGHNIVDADLKYINTFTVMNNRLWFHAFEVL